MILHARWWLLLQTGATRKWSEQVGKERGMVHALLINASGKRIGFLEGVSGGCLG
jgi:hypothetical protein